MSAADRWCPTGNHWLALDQFQVAHGKPRRDCKLCERARRERKVAEGRPSNAADRGSHLEATKEFPGVDIDRIHRIKRGG